MNLSEYKARRAAAEPTTAMRPTCMRCRKSRSTCYCHLLRPFTSPIPFVVLQHLDEARNSIATARMAHLSIRNSELITGNHFETDRRVNALIGDQAKRNVVLYPCPGATPLEQLLAESSQSDDERELVFWVLDAKWSQVPKMLRLSPNVRALPRVAFAPSGESLFTTIRSQPRPNCLSTLEAMFAVIDGVKRQRGERDTEHHALLDVFRHLVRQQLEFVSADDQRHAAAKALRRMRREAKRAAGATGE